MATATSTTPVFDAYFERREKFMKDNDLTDVFMVQSIKRDKEEEDEDEDEEQKDEEQR
jgi:hypothetical protein